MKYLVGETVGGTAVFAVTGTNAVNLSDLNADVGRDLMGLIETAELGNSLKDAIAAAPSVPVASITPALPVAKPGAISRKRTHWITSMPTRC